MPGARKRTCPGSRVAREKCPCFSSEYVDASGFDFKRFEHSDVVIVLVCPEHGPARPSARAFRALGYGAVVGRSCYGLLLVGGGSP